MLTERLDMQVKEGMGGPCLEGMSLGNLKPEDFGQ